MRLDVSRIHNLKELVLSAVYCHGEKVKAVRIGRKWFCLGCGKCVRLSD